MSEPHLRNEIVRYVAAGLRAAGCQVLEGRVHAARESYPVHRVLAGPETRPEGRPEKLEPGIWDRAMVLCVDIITGATDRNLPHEEVNNLLMPAEAFFSQNPSLGGLVESVRFYALDTDGEDKRQNVHVIRLRLEVLYQTDYRIPETFPTLLTPKVESEVTDA